MTYTYDEVLAASTKYFDGDELAAKVFVDKYAMRNEDREIIEATPEDMHRRIACELTRIQRKKYKVPTLSLDDIFETLSGFNRIIPQGGPMFGIGNPQFITLSNCYVVESPKDSYGSIMRTDEHLVQISKRRGGTGLDLSHLRPNKAPTRNSSRTSTGPICFAKRFSNSIREVGQDGRRGALMLTLSVHHPDIVEYAEAKQDLTEITGANMSIRVTDEFMNAVMEDKEYEQRWPVQGDPQIVKLVSAREVWKRIIHCAWNTAEPGLLFWDNIIQESPSDCYPGFQTTSTNPCSELPLCPNDSCRLLLLNLFGYVRDPFTSKARFDWDAYYEDVLIAQRYMDDIVDLELECIDRIIQKIKDDPEPDTEKRTELQLWLDIRQKCEQGRRTGLGQTGLGDTLAALSITYGSRKAINFTEKVYRYLKFGSYRASVEMAKELGPFPAWDWEKEKDNPFLLRFKNEQIKVNGEIIDGYDLYNDFAEFGRRNIANLTTAPAGSVSIEARTTSSAEPAYFLSSKRKKKVNPSDQGAEVHEVDANGDSWMVFDVLHPKLQMWMDITGETDVTKSPWHGCCAEDLDPYDRIKMQAAAQQHVDHAISSTINLPNSVTEEVVATIYEEGWRTGLKGVTVYRAGCRDGIITDSKSQPQVISPEKRPRSLPCDVHHTVCDGESYFVLVGLKDGKPHEVFAGRNGFLPPKIKTGQIIRKRKNYYMAKFDDTDLELSPITASTSEQQDIITRLVSLPLRTGVDMHVIVRQLEKAGEKGGMNSFNRGVARILKKYIPDGTQEHGEACPECGISPMVRQEGCLACPSCGWSKCM
jgi:ribonucleoside-diphosphate reductase alpha chain